MPTASPTEQPDLATTSILYVDRSLNFQESRAGLIFANLEGVVTEYAMNLLFKATNNHVEYEALLTGLGLAKHLKEEHLKVFIDS